MKRNLAFLVAAFIFQASSPTFSGPTNIYYMLESPDGLQTMAPLTDTGSDLPLKNSDWRCFFVGVNSEKNSVALMMKCQSKVHTDTSFVLPLYIERGDKYKTADVSLIKKKNQYDYRIVLIYSSEPLPAEMMKPQRFQRKS